jgi:hypothetical protein
MQKGQTHEDDNRGMIEGSYRIIAFLIDAANASMQEIEHALFLRVQAVETTHTEHDTERDLLLDIARRATRGNAHRVQEHVEEERREAIGKEQAFR